MDINTWTPPPHKKKKKKIETTKQPTKTLTDQDPQRNALDGGFLLHKPLPKSMAPILGVLEDTKNKKRNNAPGDQIWRHQMKPYSGPMGMAAGDTEGPRFWFCFCFWCSPP